MKSEVLFNEETRLVANMQPTVHRVYGNLYQRVEKKMNSLSKHCLAEQKLNTKQLFFERCVEIIQNSR